MRKILAFNILFSYSFCFGQIQSVVFDSITKEKIPYVNIWSENENIGTTSNKNGEFLIDSLNSGFLILSRLGYKELRINLIELPTSIFLSPKAVGLKELPILEKKETEQRIIGNFENTNIETFYASTGTPEIKARLFDYDSRFVNTPYLKKIILPIYSHLPNSEFNIRLYSVGQNGEPCDPIYEKNVIGVAKKGINNMEIDLTDLSLTFPKSGLFVGFEWLIVDENQYKLSYPTNSSKTKAKSIIIYEPKVGILSTSENSHAWNYKKGKWRKEEKIYDNKGVPYYDDYGVLAIELTLTN
ncbi:carboxypeptidase-like regulatory domain-containing protein [Spongiivirga citrea]|uniref:Carboxypeptidase-like regulatory domain-containing protein n=1 Tax=Spongiivirga citrea TaxID=1481457 RepID=A0A6M0CQ54_9FLAO|nr:carboxypeptidase-like regulatory domain-containing protein [Spongiivirga citrea]NER17999.1 carboxypeptidase-like regulatory domain-containing protein [Spongiivirga citrea]